MEQEERNQALLKAQGLFEKAKRIERRINWNNDAERDSALGRISRIINEANWQLNKAVSNRGV